MAELRGFQSKYFPYIWGVFEGGGVRGAALAGAYRAASEAGITFGRVAGTSAGAIIAALVAAGASPKFVVDALMKKNMEDFLCPAQLGESVFEEKPIPLRLFRRLTTGLPHHIGDLVLTSGLYSSRAIQEWLEELLQELLHSKRQGKNGPVEFRELNLPLHIVASDLITGKPRIWSREENPTDSVAFAVRCSCSIPFFFQAVQSGQAVYVDGGMLSNIPAFAFTRLGDVDTRNRIFKVVIFRIVEGKQNPVALSIRNMTDYATKIATTVVSGSTSIQLELQPNTYVIPIDSSDIQTTDFNRVKGEEKEWLLESGEKSVREFVQNERQHVRTAALSSTYRGFDEKLLLLVQGLMASNEMFIACSESTYWVYFTFPSLLSATRRGVQMRILTQPSNDPKEKYRRWLLSHLNAEITETQDLPFDGFLFDPHLESGSAAISSKPGIVGEDFGYGDEEIRLYSAAIDHSVIRALMSQIGSLQLTRSRNVISRLPFKHCELQRLYDSIRSVPQYRSAEMRLVTLDVSGDLLVMQKWIKEYRLLQIQQLVEAFRGAGIELFHPQTVAFDDGTDSIVTPPVLEDIGSGLVLIEGSTRLFYCLKKGIEHIKAIVVSGVSAPLPGRPVTLNTVNATSSTVPLDQMIEGLDKVHYRPIEEKVHSSKWTENK